MFNFQAKFRTMHGHNVYQDIRRETRDREMCIHVEYICISSSLISCLTRHILTIVSFLKKTWFPFYALRSIVTSSQQGAFHFFWSESDSNTNIHSQIYLCIVLQIIYNRRSYECSCSDSHTYQFCLSQ